MPQKRGQDKSGKALESREIVRAALYGRAVRAARRKFGQLPFEISTVTVATADGSERL